MDKFTQHKLNNGMQFYCIPLPNTHSIVISLYIKSGLKYERPQHIGVSHMVEHMLFRHLHDLDQRELYFQTECMGTTLKASTYKDFTRFYIEVLPKFTLKAFEIIKKLLLKNEWTNEEIRKEKTVVINQINERHFSYEDENQRIYWKDTPLNNLIMGTSSKVKKLSKKVIYDYYNLFYQPKNCCLVISGNIDKSQIEFMIEELEKIENKANSLTAIESLYPERFLIRSEKDDNIIENTGNYSEIKICFEVDYNKIQKEHSDYLYSILGDGDGSKLSLLLREELGYVDEIYTDYSRYNKFCILSINYDVINDLLPKSLDQVLNVIKSLKTKIDERDILKSEVFLSDNWIMFYDLPEDLNYHYGWGSYILEEPFKNINDIANDYKNISIEDLKRSAEELFTSKNMITFIHTNTEPNIIKNILKKWRKAL